MLYPPKCKFLTPFKWQKKKRTKYFQQSVQDAIMIQAENNNISLTEFSNNKIFMIFHVFIQWWKFHCTYTVCVKSSTSQKNRNIFLITGSFTIYKVILFGFFHVMTLWPFRSKQSCNNNNCNSNKDIKRANIYTTP